MLNVTTHWLEAWTAHCFECMFQGFVLTTHCFLLKWQTGRHQLKDYNNSQCFCRKFYQWMQENTRCQATCVEQMSAVCTRLCVCKSPRERSYIIQYNTINSFQSIQEINRPSWSAFCVKRMQKWHNLNEI